MVHRISDLLENHLTLFWMQPLTVVSFILFLFCIYKWIPFLSVSNKHLPPSPPKLPILGNLLQLGRHPYRSLQSMSKRYGELMLLHLGSVPFLVVSSATAAQDIMKTHDITFSDRPTTRTARKLVYNCKDIASAPYGEYWRQMKGICVLHLLSNTKVRSFRTVREEETALLMENIRQSAPSPVNLSDMFMNNIIDVVCRVTFGRKYSENEDGTNFKMLLKDFAEVLGSFQVGDFMPQLAWIHQLDGWDARVQKVADEFDKFLERVIQEHEECQAKDANGNNNDRAKDFVDVLLDIQKDKMADFAIDRDSIKALLMDMFAAGTDTVAAVLEWTMSELLRHPNIMEKLQREVRIIAGEKSKVEEDDLEQMKYLKAVIKETVRLHPPVPLLIARQSIHDIKIYGYEIPTGMAVITNAWAISPK